MKVLSIVGARPEFIQAAPVSRALRVAHTEVLVHTGQHYDYHMSQVFFQELDLPTPDYNLGIGSGPHGQQTGAMLAALEPVLLKEQPDWVLIRGDTNSTLAGALAASKARLPLAHIEAGARSFDRDMPEEINRLVADRLSDLLFCISPSGVENLAAEGVTEGVHYVGDVMYDAVLHAMPLAIRRSEVLSRLGVSHQGYVLATVHRAANTDNPVTLTRIVSALNSLEEPVVFPLHPRAAQAIVGLGVSFRPHVRAIEPVGYLDMLMLESSARVILTDSGGVTREAYFLAVPCVTLRLQTEHVETIALGWNTLVGSEPEHILETVKHFRPIGPRPPVYGDGAAAKRIVRTLEGSAATKQRCVAPRIGFLSLGADVTAQRLDGASRMVTRL
jgi:UDP-GlcNAc3NAcA epimerase